MRLRTAWRSPHPWSLRGGGLAGAQGREPVPGSVVIDPVLEDGELVSFAKVTRDIAGRALSAQPAPRVVLVSGLSKAQLPPLPEGTLFLPKPYRISQLLELLA